MIGWLIVDVLHPNSMITAIFWQWTWNGDEMKNEMGHKDNRVNKYRLPLEKGEMGSVGILPPVVEHIKYYSSAVFQIKQRICIFTQKITQNTQLI